MAASADQRKDALERAEAANQAAAAACLEATTAIPWSMLTEAAERVVMQDAATLMRDPKFLLGVANTDGNAGSGADVRAQRLAGLRRAKLLDGDAHFAALSVAKIFQGLATSQQPKAVWDTSPWWRRHVEVPFSAIVRCALEAREEAQAIERGSAGPGGAMDVAA